MDPLKTNELAAVTGLSLRTLHNWQAAGVIAPISRGRWDPVATVSAIVAHCRSTRTAGDARKRLLEAQADLKEFQTDRAKAVLVRRDEVEDGYRCLVGMFRAELLALPGRLAPEVAGIDSPAQARQVLDADARRTLNRLSDQLHAEAEKLREPKAR